MSNWLIEKCEAVRRSTIRRGAVETVSGYAPLALPGSTGERVRMMTVYGKTVQSAVPAPDAPVSVVGVEGKCRSRGKNLFDRESITDIDVGGNGTIRKGISFTNLNGTFKISAQENKAYVYTRTKVNGVYSAPISLTTSNTITMTPDVTFFVWSAGDYSHIYYSNTQFELGPTVTPYAPFASPSLIAHPTLHGIPLASTATDYTYIDSNGVKYAADTWQWREEGVWEHVQRVGVKVFDGTETIGLYLGAFYTQQTGKKPGLENAISNAYSPTNLPVASMPDGTFRGSLNSSTIYFKDSRFADAAAFKTNLAANPVTVYYELATPIITQYPAVPWMHTIDASHAGNPLDVAYLDNIDGTTVMPWIQASYYKEVVA